MQIWLHLLKVSLMENFIFCAVGLDNMSPDLRIILLKIFKSLC